MAGSVCVFLEFSTTVRFDELRSRLGPGGISLQMRGFGTWNSVVILGAVFY
jgi:hypothetical protein